jgi:hypothetical protein
MISRAKFIRDVEVPDGYVGAGLATHKAALPSLPQHAFPVVGTRLELTVERSQIYPAIRTDLGVIGKVQKALSNVSVEKIRVEGDQSYR